MPNETKGRLTEVTHRGFETLNNDGVDAWIDAYTTPEFVWDVEPMGLGRYEGRAAYKEFFDDWVSSYDQWFSEVSAIEELGPALAVADVRQGGTLRGSEQSIELRWAQVTLWEGERVREVINYSTLEEARAAAEKVAESGGA